jgi:hypothetical protein
LNQDRRDVDRIPGREVDQDVIAFSNTLFSELPSAPSIHAETRPGFCDQEPRVGHPYFFEERPRTGAQRTGVEGAVIAAAYHDYRNTGALCIQVIEDLQTVHPRKLEIENQTSGRLGVENFQELLGRSKTLSAEAHRFYGRADHPTNVYVIIDNVHRSFLSHALFPRTRW